MTAPAARPRRFRQASAVALGGLFVVMAVLLGVASIATGDVGGGLLFLAGAPAVAAVLVWPCVELGPDGVVLRNVGIDTTVPWRLVDDCETRWNLKVWTHTKAYTAWAVSASRRGHLPQHHMLGAGLNPMNMGSPTRVEAAAEAGVERHARQVHAASVADAVESAKKQFDELVASGALEPGTGEVRRAFSPVSGGLLLLALVLAAVGAALVA